MDVQVSVLDKWPQLFFDYGLFFITLVFILVVVRGTGKNLQAAVDAKADAATIRYWRRMNTAMWAFTCLLVVATCIWWTVRKEIESTKAFVVRIDISDAQPTDILEPFSDNLFYRNQDPLDAARRKDTFIAVAEKPFRLKQPLVIIHKKGADAAVGVRYTVPVDETLLDQRFAEYRLVLNPQKGKYELVPVSTPSPRGAIISSAFAGGPQTVISGERINLPPSQPNQSFPAPPALRLPSANAKPNAAPPLAEAAIAASLLNETGSLSRQLDAIDALAAAVDRGSPLDLYQRRAGTDETLLSYLITLSHHEDKLLRYKSQQLLHRADYTGIVAKVATGKSRQPQEVERRILASLQPADWEAVEARLRAEGAIIDANVTRRRGASPVPSATVEGTQYYGVTTWSALRQDQASCLANVVYRQNDVPGARPDEALGFVRSREGFAFSFRTKSEAIVFAEAARKCGASTEFVYKDDKKLARFREE